LILQLFFSNLSYGLTSSWQGEWRPGDSKEASALINQVDGVYKHQFKNSLVEGTSFESEDILEIVKVSNDAIYFKIHLEFYNAHTCNLHGIARYTKDKAFLFKATTEEKCNLKIVPTAEGIQLIDGPHGTPSCRDFYCGMRGSFNNYTFKKSNKRPIRYMKRLKNRL
jgi:hypothetical protein